MYSVLVLGLFINYDVMICCIDKLCYLYFLFLDKLSSTSMDAYTHDSVGRARRLQGEHKQTIGKDVVKMLWIDFLTTLQH